MVGDVPGLRDREGEHIHGARAGGTVEGRALRLPPSSSWAGEQLPDLTVRHEVREGRGRAAQEGFLGRQGLGAGAAPSHTCPGTAITPGGK